MVVLCTLLWCGAIAHAERRPVAVIDLSGDPATAQLATDIYTVLLSHPDLQPIGDPSISAELKGPFRDDDEQHLTDAATAKATAEQQLDKFPADYAVGEVSATNGEQELLVTTPTPKSLQTFSQLAFLRGRALLGIPPRASEARASFALAHRLDPSFTPDEGRFPPDVTGAFRTAKAAFPGKGRLAVAGTGKLWVDGKESGTAPIEIEVDAGPHVVWLTGTERQTRGSSVLVEPNKKIEVVIAEAAVTTQIKVRRARAALRTADATARVPAMTVIADLVGVKDAVLLTSPKGNIVWQTWNVSTKNPGFSSLEEVKKKKPIDLLTPLAPPRPKEEPRNVGVVAPPVETPPWYKRRPVQATIVIGAVALAIGSYYLYTRLTDSTVTWSPDVTQSDPTARALIRW